VTYIGEPLDLTKPERVANAGDDLIPYQFFQLLMRNTEENMLEIWNKQPITSSFPTLQHLHL